MELIRRFAIRAETLKYQGLWVQEQILGRAYCLEPLSLLSYLAGITTNTSLGTAVVIASTRNPVLLAKSLATLDQMSNGRLIAGIALGGVAKKYPLLGGPSNRRVRHFVESVEVIKAIWTQSGANYAGHFWNMRDEISEPKPVQQPHPPLWFGGRHEDSLRRAARYADGWIGAGSTTTVQFRNHVSTLVAALEESGRDPSQFPISKRVYVSLDPDENRAERGLRTWFDHRYGNADLGSEVSVWGSASRCIEGLIEVVESGAQMIILDTPVEPFRNMETLHAEVVPNLPLPTLHPTGP